MGSSICTYAIFVVSLRKIYQVMKLLFILLSFMTLTVQDKNTVFLSDGQWPYDIETRYSNTYNKGQVRAGDVATLTLSNLGGITVDTITMALRSNQNEGEGTVRVVCNGQQVASKHITYQTVGEKVAVYAGKKAGVDSLTISLAGSENSLYIDSYTIVYSSAQPFTVTLMNGTEQYRVLTGTSVPLPTLPDTVGWRFLGWTAQHFWSAATMPDLIGACAYKPTSDITLWAVYEYIPSLDELIVTDLQDGVYIYASWASQLAMTGSVYDGVTRATAVNTENMNQWYQITFDPDGLATIQSGTQYIGYSGKALADKPSKWLVYHDGQITAFYTVMNGKNYVLFPGLLTNDYASTFDTKLLQADDLTTAPTVLLSAEPVMEEPYFTCYPNAPMGVTDEVQEAIQNERMIRFGIYELHIQGGKKFLRLR